MCYYDVVLVFFVKLLTIKQSVYKFIKNPLLLDYIIRSTVFCVICLCYINCSLTGVSDL